MTIQRISARALSLLIMALSGCFSTYLSAENLSDQGLLLSQKAQLTSQASSLVRKQVASSPVNNHADNHIISSNWQTVSDEELDTLRGGFTLPSGLIVDFSFDRRIYQNGIEAFYTYFELPQNSALSRGVSSDLAANFTNMLLNSVTQNSLDNQVIRTINTINIDISNIKNANFDANRSEFFRNVVSPGFK
ncbi:hypothetical protein [Neptunomonas sp.]|uniref:hypothetical protein n=1 Tax=Neptunomonas sp. TaxID=1971898 RepID=UPI00356A4E21